jgi:hypothetical protein
MDATQTGSLTAETLTYDVTPNNNNFGWISGPGQPGLTLWPATKYTVTLNIVNPNPNLEIERVRIFRVDSTGGPQFYGLATISDLTGLAQTLGAAGPVTFVLNGSQQAASATDRLAVKIDVWNNAPSVQSFGYDAGVGAVSNVKIGP